MFFYSFVVQKRKPCIKLFHFIIFLLILPMVYTGCISRKGNTTDGKENGNYIAQLESLIGVYPNITVRKIDSILPGTDTDERYKLLLTKSNALRDSAFDFLLKPIDKKEFEIVISRFLLEYETKAVQEEKPVIQDTNRESSFMVIQPTGEMRMVKTADVGFFRHISDRKIWEAVLVTGESVALRRNVSADFLCSFNKSFIQVHQSYIVNMDYLVMIQDNYCILYPPFENVKEVTVSRKYKKNLMDHFCIF